MVYFDRWHSLTKVSQYDYVHCYTAEAYLPEKNGERRHFVPHAQIKKSENRAPTRLAHGNVRDHFESNWFERKKTIFVGDGFLTLDPIPLARPAWM